MATDNAPDPPAYLTSSMPPLAVASVQNTLLLPREPPPWYTLSPSEVKSTSIPSRTPNLSNRWEFAGWGSTKTVALRERDGSSWEEGFIEYGNTESGIAAQGHRLTVWQATSISGNDLIASVLYTVGLCGAICGPLAPIAMLLVLAVLYPFQSILSEVGTALPFNGGSYNLLLNTTSKTKACIAATLSLLSYLATAVVSAAGAGTYVAQEFSSFDPFWPTIGILVVFALITILGVKESARLSMAIFTLHCLALMILIVTGIVRWCINGSGILEANWNYMVTSWSLSEAMYRLYMGYSIALLGVTGFETSCNFIEELRPGTYPPTVRNLWTLAFVFNIPVTLLSVVLVPYQDVVANPSTTLLIMAQHAAGSSSRWLRWIIAIDAVIVLCAGVLTAMLGVSGLIARMAEDRILPSCLLTRNPWTHTQHWISISFLAVCIALFAGCRGDITSLSGMFAAAFLGVMCTFAVGNLLLKYARERLPRSIRTPTLTVVLSLACLVCGLVGVMVHNPSVAVYFFIYFVVLFSVMLTVLHRTKLAKAAYFYVDKVLALHKYGIAEWIVKKMQMWTRQPVVFLTDTDEIHILNKAILYVNQNESAKCLKLVHFYEREADIPARLEAHRRVLDELYPKMTIDLILVPEPFSPEGVKRLEKTLNVPPSLMFMACPGGDFPYAVADFGGVRIIML